MGIYRGPNIVRDGLVFGYDADDRSSRFYPGEPTTNLISGTSNPSLSTTGWGQAGWSGSVTVDTNEDALVLTATNGWHDMNYSFGVLNLPITISFQYKLKSQQTGGIYGYVLNGTNLGSYVTSFGNIYPNLVSYQTFTVTFTPTTNSKIVIGLRGVDNGGLTDVMYIKNLQVEQKTHKTQYTLTSRSLTQGLIDLKKSLSIDLSNVSFDSTAHPTFDGTDGISISTTLGSRVDGQPLTVECVMKPGRLAGQYQDIIVNRGDAAWNWMLYQHADDGAISFHAGNTQNKSTFIPTVGKWYHVVATVTGAGVCTLYINGSVVQQNNAYLYGTGQPNLLCIGKFGTSSEYYLGEIRVAKLYNKALSNTEVLQNYQSYKYRFNIV